MQKLEDMVLLETNTLSAKDIENLTHPAERYLIDLIAHLYSWQKGLKELGRDDAVQKSLIFRELFAETMLTDIKALNDSTTEKMFDDNPAMFRLVETMREKLEITPNTSEREMNTKLKKLLSMGQDWDRLRMLLHLFQLRIFWNVLVQKL